MLVDASVDWLAVRTKCRANAGAKALEREVVWIRAEALRTKAETKVLERPVSRNREIQ